MKNIKGLSCFEVVLMSYAKIKERNVIYAFNNSIEFQIQELNYNKFNFDQTKIITRNINNIISTIIKLLNINLSETNKISIYDSEFIIMIVDPYDCWWIIPHYHRTHGEHAILYCIKDKIIIDGSFSTLPIPCEIEELLSLKKGIIWNIIRSDNLLVEVNYYEYYKETKKFLLFNKNDFNYHLFIKYFETNFSVTHILKLERPMYSDIIVFFGDLLISRKCFYEFIADISKHLNINNYLDIDRTLKDEIKILEIIRTTMLYNAKKSFEQYDHIYMLSLIKKFIFLEKEAKHLILNSEIII